MVMTVSSKSFGKNKWIHNCFNLSTERECLSNLFKIPKEIGDTISHQKVVVMDNFSDHDVKMAFPMDEDDASRSRIRIRKKKLPRGGFSRVLKGVFFQASSSRKKRSKKVGEESDDLSTRIQKALKIKKAPPISSASGAGENIPFDGSSSNSSSLFTSSSLSSNSRSGSERKTTDLNESNMMKTKSSILLKKKCGDYNCNYGLYFLLICLVGLVFCGKAFAIFCTATCLLLFPIPSRKHVDFPLDFDFDHDLEHRRKVEAQ